MITLELEDSVLSADVIKACVEQLKAIGFADANEGLGLFVSQKSIGNISIVAFYRHYMKGIALYIDGGDRENSLHLPSAKTVDELRLIISETERFLMSPLWILDKD